MFALKRAIRASGSLAWERCSWARTARFVRLDTLFKMWQEVRGDTLPDYGIGIAPSTVKVLRDVPFQGEMRLTARLRLCRNEYEAFQIVMIPVSKAIRGVEVSWTDLTGLQGATISRNRLEVHRVGYVKTRPPGYPVDYVGWHPDPLMPLARFDAQAGQNQPIWVGLKTPEGIPAGFYRGKITIRPANARPIQVTLMAEVWDIRLPRKTALKTAFSSWHDAWSAWYGLKETPPALKRQYFKFLLDRGWIDRGYVYGFDEVGSAGYAEVLQAYGILKKNAPDLKTAWRRLPEGTIAP